VHPDATAAEIRAAYRDRARRHHPDRTGWSGGDVGDSAAAMSSVNEAYRVLNDPGRRANYDRSLFASPERRFDDLPPDVADLDVDAPPPAYTPLSPSGPARLPWRLMLIAALVGSAIVLVAAAFTDAPSEEPPDGILRTGSCVEIEPNGDAREVACTGDGDTVVELLLPTGARCPQGTVAHRDRLGLGTACIQS
jgi:molecular chaperone DnaJ